MTSRSMRILALITAALATSACRAARHTETFDWQGPIAPGATLHVRDMNGDVIINRGSTNAAIVHGVTAWTRVSDSDVRYVTTRDGNDYYLCAVWGKRGTCGPSGYHNKTGGGFLSIFSLFHHGNNARADITVSVPAGVIIDASSVSGDVEVHNAAAAVTARTVSGSVVAEGATRIEAKSVSGDISVATSGVSDSIDAKTVSGDVTAKVPSGFAGSVDIKTANGDASANLPGATQDGQATSHVIRLMVGHGAGSVHLVSTNGDVKVSGP